MMCFKFSNPKITALRFATVCVAIAASLGLSASANASLVELKWDEQGRFQHRGEIKAGGILEVCGTLMTGAKIDWQYQSTQVVDFNIHYHQGNQVIAPVKLRARKTASSSSIASSASKLFEVDQTNDYCWMWSNKSKQSTKIHLRLSLR
ncbi:hypothetical protein [Undibacterium fentianense]|uniref:Uncharacterized protein n=1 Tax=Undibacterium fentianense TaxID=2828728 RepID=A0A941E2M2_9BURK|nr:hypothetical protein [Undibacterium fentianense]MBR7801200.1 hypothetical protein [Undibacterium fentianense]